MLLFITFAMLVAVNGDCPAFNPLNEPTAECLWSPITVRRQIMDHCGIEYDEEHMKALEEELPHRLGFWRNYELPKPCGGCSFKLRCQDREKSPDCFHLNGETSTCGNEDSEGAHEICKFDKQAKIGCHYGTFKQGLIQCVNGYPHSQGLRQTFLDFVENVIPDMTCMEVEGKCHCCCSPKKPSEDGLTCVDYEELDNTLKDECKNVEGLTGEMGSDCIWFGTENVMSNFVDNIKTACDVEQLEFNVPNEDFGDLNTDVQLPEKCGYCSFKLKCMKRPEDSRCFPFTLEKKLCGNEENCENCSKPCEMDALKVEDSEDPCDVDVLVTETSASAAAIRMM